MMELDDLRRQWQQPEADVPPLLTARDLDAFAKSRAAGLVETMRRNAWLEMIVTVLLCVGVAVGLALLQDKFGLLYCATLLTLGVLSLLIYGQLLHTLRQMDEPTGSVHQHLATLAHGMRHLLRFYYRLTLTAVLLTSLTLYGFMLWQMANRGELGRWPKTGIITALFGVIFVVTQLSTVHFTRWYLQRLYGQHLDRLESQLRELDEPAG